MPNFFQIIKDDRVVLNADHVIRYYSDEEEQIHSLASVAQGFRSDFPQSRAHNHTGFNPEKAGEFWKFT